MSSITRVCQGGREREREIINMAQFDLNEVCVCVCERERERERKKESKRD